MALQKFGTGEVLPEPEPTSEGLQVQAQADEGVSWNRQDAAQLAAENEEADK